MPGIIHATPSGGGFCQSKMNENTVKHLEFIQAVITRLGQNSFAYKRWSITLTAAIFVLAAKESNPQYLFVALIPVIGFWGLDAYYLRQENLFRKLYDAVRRGELEDNPFSMDTSPYKNDVPTWVATCWSKTIGFLYGPMVFIIVIVNCV